MSPPADVGEGARSLRRSPRFVRFWAGHAISAFGDQISALALPFIAVTLLNASPAQVGLLTAAIWLPNLLALLVGTWVDHLRRRHWVLVGANLLQCLAAMVVPVASLAGRLSLPMLYLAALMLGAGGVLYNSAYPSFFVRLVRKNQYVSANSLLSSTIGVSAVTGPAVAGALIQTVTAPLAVLVDSASFLISALAIATVRTPPQQPTAQAEAYLRRLVTGAAYLRHHGILRATLAASTTLNLANLAIQALLVLYATRELHLTAAHIGFALGAGAVGGLVGAVTAARLTRRIGLGRTIAAGAGLTALPYLALPLAAHGPTSGLVVLGTAELVSSWAVIVFDINNNSLRAAVTRDDMRARVAGAYSTINYGIRPIGALLGGAAATLIGAGPTIAAAALLGALATIWITISPISALHTITDV